MKRIAVLMLLFLVLPLSACQGNTFSLDDGRYVLEESVTDGISLPYLLVNDGKMTVIHDIAVSYQPSGTLDIDGNGVVLDTSFANEPCTWTFILTDDDTLVFSSDKSDVPNNWEGWDDGLTFVLTED